MSEAVCPACGEQSDKIYRCSECGHDLARSDASSANRADSATGGN